MNFFRLTEIIKEAKFTSPQQVRSITTQELTNFIKDTLIAQYGEKQVSSYDGYGKSYVSLKAEDRDIDFTIEDSLSLYRKAPINLPVLYISFGWRYNAHIERPSHKDDTDREYRVRQKAEKDSIGFAHVLRDQIIRPLSHRAILLHYIPIGLRRDNWYSSILKQSGFKQVDPKFQEYWIPIALTGISITPKAMQQHDYF